MKRTAALLAAVMICLAAVPALAGWESSGGRYWYAYDNGGYAKNEWIEYQGAWYYCGGDGWMVTGWQQIDGDWYYFDTDGAMATGWKQIKGAWYFLGDNGIMRTGWHGIDGERYCFGEDGALASGWTEDDSHRKYYFAEDGKSAKGWQKLFGSWYYFHGTGELNTMIRPFAAEKTGAAEEYAPFYTFTGSGTGSMAFKPEDMADDKQTALFSAMIMTDYANARMQKPDEGVLFDANLLSYPSYTGTDGSYINLMIVHERSGYVFLAFYDTKTKNAYCFYDQLPPQHAESAFDALCPDGYRKNSAAALYDTYLSVQEEGNG